MVKARFAASSPAAAGQNRPMTVRERQHLHLQLTKMEEINARAPGSVYSLDTDVTPRGMRLRFIWNRDSGAGGAAAQPPADADKAKAAGVPAASTRAHKPRPATPARPPSAPKGKPTGKPSAQPRDRKSGDADQQPAPTDPAAPITAAEAEEMRSAIAHRVAHHAQAAGLPAGDDGARLFGDLQPLKLGTHKVRGVRLLRDSPAANLSADLFNAAVEKIISTARPRGGIRIGAPLDDPSMAQLDELLVPPAGATLPSTSEMELENDNLFK